MNDQANLRLIVTIVFIVFVIIFWYVQTGPHANEDSPAEKRLRRIKEAEKYAKIKREADEEEKRLKRHAEKAEAERIRAESQIWVSE